MVPGTTGVPGAMPSSSATAVVTSPTTPLSGDSGAQLRRVESGGRDQFGVVVGGTPGAVVAHELPEDRRLRGGEPTDEPRREVVHRLDERRRGRVRLWVERAHHVGVCHVVVAAGQWDEPVTAQEEHERVVVQQREVVRCAASVHPEDARSGRRSVGSDRDSAHVLAGDRDRDDGRERPHCGQRVVRGGDDGRPHLARILLGTAVGQEGGVHRPAAPRKGVPHRVHQRDLRPAGAEIDGQHAVGHPPTLPGATPCQ